MAGPSKPDRIYLDSCVWIAWINGDQDVQAPIQRVMEWSAARQLRLIVSPLLLVEALGARPTAVSLSDPSVDPVLDLLMGPEVVIAEFDVTVAIKARELRRHQIIKPAADAIHLAHAICAAADVFFTLDEDDFPLGTTVDGVHVERPYMLGDPSLFDEAGS